MGLSAKQPSSASNLAPKRTPCPFRSHERWHVFFVWQQPPRVPEISPTSSAGPTRIRGQAPTIGPQGTATGAIGPHAGRAFYFLQQSWLPSSCHHHHALAILVGGLQLSKAEGGDESDCGVEVLCHMRTWLSLLLTGSRYVAQRMYHA
ncbi:hypothetical protein V2G26_014308 [Clonostachys chloroleuca]